jgi:CBS domain-containing protein
MLVSHILREKGRDVLAIAPASTLAEAARVLTKHRIGALIVRDQDGALSGIISERDIVRAISEDGAPALVEDDNVVGIISIGDVVKTRIAETMREAQALKDYIAAG